MATLKSEDNEYSSFLVLSPGASLTIKPKTNGNKLMPEEQTWQYFSLNLGNGPRTLSFTTPPDSFAHMEFENEIQNAVEDIQAVAHAYLFCRSPQDEVEKLIEKIESLFTGEKAQLLFEPAEPSFDLTISKVGGGYRVECFVDAGNVETGIYRFDALGIRFFTTEALLKDFIKELKADFAC
jgi:hypothetical protein